MSKKDDAEYDDIIKFEPKPIQVVSDDETNNLLWDLSHSVIIKILRQGPMTVREIEAKYNEEAKAADNLEQKSDITIYRYLKVLEKAGLVIQAGRRVYFTKTATEILYARAALVFQTRGLPLSYWRSERGRTFFERVFAAMNGVSEGQVPIKKCIDEFIYKFESAKDEQIDKWTERMDKESLELITGGDWWEISQTLGYVGIFGLLLNQPDLLQEFLNCFKKQK